MRTKSQLIPILALLFAGTAAGSTIIKIVRPSREKPSSTPTPQGPRPTPHPCSLIEEDDQRFGSVVARFTAQDDLAPPAMGGLVLVGSSAVLRWRSAARVFAEWSPIQRGIGGARLSEIARWVEPLVARHRPLAVVVSAGAEDIAEGRTPESVAAAWQCLMAEVQPWMTVYCIGITPSPAQWGLWPQAQAANVAVREVCARFRNCRYLDAPQRFLSTGQPPAAELFLEDGTHLSAAGYELLEAEVWATLPRKAMGRPPPSKAVGATIRVDLGPNDGFRGRAAWASGARWNTWHPARDGVAVLAGEALRDLRSIDGQATGVDLEIGGGFRAEGWRSGGLRSPSSRLGAFAVADATSDFFCTDDDDDPAVLTWTGLPSGFPVTLRVFASRVSRQELITRFRVLGSESPAVGTVRIGGGGAGNTTQILTLDGLIPDAWGQLHLEVDRVAGDVGCINAVELTVAGLDQAMAGAP